MLSGVLVEERPDMEYSYEAVVTSNLVDSISVIVCERSASGRPPSEVGSGNLRSVLSAFYDEYYQHDLGPTELPRSVPRTHLATYFDYFAKEVVTVYKSNISMHYKDHVKRYFEYILGKEQMKATKNDSPDSMTQVELTEVERDWSTNYDLVVRDVLCMEFQTISDQRVYNFQSDPMHHPTVQRERRRVLPQHVREAVSSFDLDADIVQHPLRLSLIHISEPTRPY